MRPATRNTLLFIITLIGLLLLVNIYLIDRNNSIIEENKILQAETEEVKVNTVDIIRNVHFLDMNLRGYALSMAEHNERDIDTAKLVRDRTFGSLETALKAQNYPMEKFYFLRDSINAYFVLVDSMKRHLDQGRQALFINELRMNRGYFAWAVYNAFAADVNAFETRISKEAQVRYDRALRNSYFLQVVLFFIIVPTLGYTAFYTFKSMQLADALWRAQQDKNQILQDQKTILEQRVLERTEEILSKNNIIEEQSKVIRLKNMELSEEVKNQTQHLEEVNAELTEHNHRLEQFTYIISHNLRSPITRLVGLSNILGLAKDEEEKTHIVQLIIKSTHTLDQIITDLNLILAIQKLNEKAYTEIDLEEVIGKTTKMLEHELRESRGKLIIELSHGKTIRSFLQYIESVFYNLLSNAIKYRNPERPLIIRIHSRTEEGQFVIDVADNGLGIDTEKNAAHLFNLYKRFHLHVEGKGVGLYLIKTQLAALGATIHLDSEPNEGSKFTLRFELPSAS